MKEYVNECVKYMEENGEDGCCSQIATSDDFSQIAISGDESNIATNGYGSQIATNGDDSKIVTNGDWSKVVANGDRSKIVTNGDESKANIQGKNSVGASIGKNSKIKGVIGTWITLAEYNSDEMCVGMKCGMIDGITLKENVWYTLENGKFVEVE